MDQPQYESVELMYDEDGDEIYEEEIIEDDDDGEVLEEYEIEYIDEEVVEDSEYEVVEYVNDELEDEARVEPQDEEGEPEEPTTTAHTIQAVEVQVTENLKEDEVLVVDAPEERQTKEESTQETPDVEVVQNSEDDISTKNDENDAISDEENKKPAAPEAQLKNDAVIADGADLAVDEKIVEMEAQVASAPSDRGVPKLEAQDVRSEQLSEVEQQDSQIKEAKDTPIEKDPQVDDVNLDQPTEAKQQGSKIEEAKDTPVEEDPQVKEAVDAPAPAEQVVKEAQTSQSNLEPSGKRNGSDAEKTPKAHNKSIGQAPISPNKHRESKEKTIEWEKPDWVKSSPLKSPKKKVDALLMSPGKQIGWEKPNWVEAKLKSTGADVKKGVDLQAPITHVEKDEKNTINLEANPLYLKPTEKGTAVRLGENLARPITFINGKEPSVK